MVMEKQDDEVENPEFLGGHVAWRVDSHQVV